MNRQTISPGRAETLSYIHGMLAQLWGLAEAEHYDMLTYLIDMAYIESGELQGSTRSPIRKDKRDSAA